MLATSVAVHEPSATSSSSTGEGADERCESVSSTSARPPGVMPTKRSSATNRTIALPVADIHQLRRKHNTAKKILGGNDRDAFRSEVIETIIDLAHQLRDSIGRERFRDDPVDTRGALLV